MDAGTLYVAPIGSTEPDMGVNGGAFDRPWGPAWIKLGPCDLSINYDPPRDLYEVDADPEGPTFGPLRAIVGHGVLVALGFESADRTVRYVFPRIRDISPTARRDRPMSWRFVAPAEYGPTKYSAGSSPVLPVPRTPAPVLQVAHSAPIDPWRPAPFAPYGGEAVEMVPGRLRGFRTWKVLPGVDGAPPRLASITADVVWPWIPTVEARCHRNDIANTGLFTFDSIQEHDPDDVPAAECSCGIYARHLSGLGMGRAGAGQVSGVIEAWGKVEVGNQGFRARYARLVALATTPGHSWSVAGSSDMVTYDRIEDTPLPALGELYQVPVFDNEREMWEKYPAGDVRELLGQPPCAGCEANRRGDYAIHTPECRAEHIRSTHQNHLYALGPGRIFTGPASGSGVWRTTWKSLGYTNGS